MDKNILEYFTKKYNTNDTNVKITFYHDNGGSTEYTIKEAIKEFEESLKWFFDMLPKEQRSYEKAFNMACQLFDKHLKSI